VIVIHPDLFVGVVAIAIGLLLIYCVVFNWQSVHESRMQVGQLPTLSFLGLVSGIISRFGRLPTRIFLGLVGIAMLMIGGYLILGLLLTRHETQRQQNSERVDLQMHLAVAETF
jgi:hypothetical protein